MRIVCFMLVMLVPIAASAQSPLRPFEVTASGGFSDGPGYASRSPQAGVAVSLGTSWLRLNGSGSHGWLHKAGTSGGYQRSYAYSLEIGARNVFLFGGTSRNFVDQTEYTKTVHYAFGGAGYRWASYRDGNRPVSINDIRATYYHETFSTYANDAQQFALGYSWDRRLTGALYLRCSLRLGAMYFNDNPYPGAARRRGMTSSFNIGLVGRP